MSIRDNINDTSMSIRRFFLTILLMTSHGLDINGHVTNINVHGDVSTKPVHDAISIDMGNEIRQASDENDTDKIGANREKATNMDKDYKESNESLGIFIQKLK